MCGGVHGADVAAPVRVLEFRVSGFRAWGVSGLQGLGFWVFFMVLGFRVLGFRILGSEQRVLGVVCRARSPVRAA